MAERFQSPNPPGAPEGARREGDFEIPAGKNENMVMTASTAQQRQRVIPITSVEQASSSSPVKKWVMALVGLVAVLAGAGISYYLYREGRFANFVVPTSQKNNSMNVQKALAYLDEMNSSAQKGESVLLPTKDGGVNVFISISNGATETPQAVYIKKGTCSETGSTLFHLEDTVNNAGFSTINISLAQLLRSQPLSIAIHRNTDEQSPVALCGEVSAVQ